MVNLLPLCDYWGWDEFAPGQPGSSPQFLSVEQASDRLDFGPCPLAQKQSSWTQEGIRWKIPCFDQPSSHTGQTTVLEMVEQIGQRPWWSLLTPTQRERGSIPTYLDGGI